MSMTKREREKEREKKVEGRHVERFFSWREVNAAGLGSWDFSR